MKDLLEKKNKMETKRTFSSKEIKEKGLSFIKECLKNPNFKEISFESKIKNKK
jgi:pantoate kinase